MNSDRYRWSRIPLKTRRHKGCGDLMAMAEFVACCKSRCLIDYDGYGNYATADLETNLEVKPSMVKRNEVFTETYSHVVWYNR